MPHDHWKHLTPQRIEVFWSYVLRKGPDDCWDWGLTIYPDGYGRFQLGRRSEGSHIVAWKIAHPEYVSERYVKTLDHTCKNRKCVNIKHLQVVTHTENVMLGDGWGATNARKTECNKGHKFTPENTRVESSGSRRCLTCERSRVR